MIKYVPNQYPLSGSPTYGPREVIDPSGEAKGISVDPSDDRLFIAEGNRVDTYGSEAQTFAIRNATGGTYKLRFEGAETAPIPYNASAAEVQAALEAVPAIGPGGAAVSTLFGGATQILFSGHLAYTDVAQLEVVPSLSGNEVDKLTVKATAGTYTLSFEGQATAPIAFNAPASGAGSVQAALEALPNLRPATSRSRAVPATAPARAHT